MQPLFKSIALFVLARQTVFVSGKVTSPNTPLSLSLSLSFSSLARLCQAVNFLLQILKLAPLPTPSVHVCILRSVCSELFKIFLRLLGTHPFPLLYQCTPFYIVPWLLWYTDMTEIYINLSNFWMRWGIFLHEAPTSQQAIFIIYPLLSVHRPLFRRRTCSPQSKLGIEATCWSWKYYWNSSIYL